MEHVKQIRQSLQIIIILCLLFFVGSLKPVRADSQPLKRVTVQLYANQNGTPIRGGIYTAINLENVYQRIINGTITQEETQTASWKAIQIQLQQDGDEIRTNLIQFPNGQSLGPDIKHSPEEALMIMENILRTGGWGSTLMTELNGPTESIRFHQPDRGKASNSFTNNQGEAVGSILTGMTAIMSGGNTLNKLVNITDNNQQINIDAANIDSRLTLTLENQDEANRSNFGTYLIDSSKTLTYKLKISKDLNHLGGILTLKSNSNLIIDSIDTQAEELVQPTIEKAPEQKDVTNPNWQITFPDLSHDLILSINVHVAPMPVKDIDSLGGTLSVFGVDDNGIGVSSVSPPAVLGGANFVMVDHQKNKLEVGGEYVLGKKEGNDYLIYSDQNGWVQTKNLDTIDLSQVKVLQGGNQYFMGTSTPFEIPEATYRFNYDSEKNKEINQSLIQIIGLPKGEHYFLYPVKAATGYQLTKIPFDFSIFSQFSIGRNGTVLTKSSLENAKSQDFSLNTSIPDFQTNVNEYNALDVSGNSSPKMNAMSSIVIPIIIACILMIVIMIIFIKFL